MQITEIKKKFKNLDVFKAIFISPNSDPKKFQRLEFLGDRVLGLVVADLLFDRFKKYNEGKLAKFYAHLTSAKVISQIAKNINLIQYLDQKGFKNISERVLSDFLEAVIGALYLDIGLNETKKIIHQLWDNEVKNNNNFNVDYKSTLQEWTQSKKMGLPEYKIISKSGPDHNPVFEIRLVINDKEKISAFGSSIQIAEQNVAKSFLKEKKLV